MHVSSEDTQISIEQQSNSRPRIRIAGALLSALVPGTGQWLLRDMDRGLKFFLGFVFLGILYWPIRLPHYFFGLLCLVLYAIALAIVSSYFALTASSSKAAPISAWWMLAVIPIALMSALGLQLNILLLAAGFRVFTIPSTSMAPTLTAGDTIVADMRHFGHTTPKDGEVIIFKHNGIYLVKRLAAIGSERISSHDGAISVNGSPANEPYAHHERRPDEVPQDVNDFETKVVPANELFLLGDNRDLSLDSRMEEFGKVFSTDVVGVPLYILSSKSDRTGHKVQ
jgi:signal peptidase I